MSFSRTVAGSVYRFDDLKTLLAKATPERSGDQLAGVAAQTALERMAARLALADLPLRTFLSEQVVPYESDEVTRLIVDTHDAAAFAPISHLTVGGWRDWLLSTATTSETLAALASGVTPEMAAAVSKLMRNQDLIVVARKCHVVTRFRNTIGLPGRLAVRLQPNHPTDDLRGVAASMLDGLLYGSGDAVVGINPASDNIPVLGSMVNMLADVIARYEIPTQNCVLTHVTNTLRLIEAGVPVDLVFQSVAGTEKANDGFGINLALLREAQDAALSLKRGTVGNDVMYFETGQGSALSAGAHHGIDQQTCEARAYAVAREFKPLLTNTVVGFIGPEYLYDGKEITARAGRSFLREAPRPADGLRYLLHQPCRGGSGRHGRAAHVARGCGLHLHHGRARCRRRDAELPEHVVSRRAGATRSAGTEAGTRVRSLARAHGHRRQRWPATACEPASCIARRC
jgi:ethanolamine ammonia-lyase large subunit